MGKPHPPSPSFREEGEQLDDDLLGHAFDLARHEGGIELRDVGAGLQLDRGAALWADVSLDCDRHPFTARLGPRLVRVQSIDDGADWLIPAIAEFALAVMIE